MIKFFLKTSVFFFIANANANFQISYINKINNETISESFHNYNELSNRIEELNYNREYIQILNLKKIYNIKNVNKTISHDVQLTLIGGEGSGS